MFRILEEYTPLLVPASIDEGFLDFTSMDKHVWCDTTPLAYMQAIGARIRAEVGLPVSGGLGNSSRLAKLATDAAKPGFFKVASGQEKEFLKDRPPRELFGIGERRERALSGLGMKTFGEAAKTPSMLLKQKFGIWGQELWLFANGQWQEPLLLEVQDRASISSNTTLPYDEHDYEAALTFTFSEATRLAQAFVVAEAGGGLALRPRVQALREDAGEEERVIADMRPQAEGDAVISGLQRRQHFRDKILQQLQVLRDAKLLIHVGSGIWRLP